MSGESFHVLDSDGKRYKLRYCKDIEKFAKLEHNPLQT